jgi:hypothetical protein
MVFANAEDERLYVDKEILKLEAALLALWRRRNALSVISRTPLELLLEIFTTYRDMVAEPSPRWWGETCHSLSRMCVANVSTQWRSAALFRSHLWHRVVLCGHFSPRRLELVFARTVKATLSVELYKISNPASMQLALWQLYGIRTLLINDCPNKTLCACFVQLEQLAPLLHTLHINDDSDGDLPIPRAFLNDDALKLRRIFLDPAPPYWFGRIFHRSNIRCLYVGNQELDPPIFFSGLSQFPNLWSLSICAFKMSPQVQQGQRLVFE